MWYAQCGLTDSEMQIEGDSVKGAFRWWIPLYRRETAAIASKCKHGLLTTKSDNSAQAAPASDIFGKYIKVAH